MRETRFAQGVIFISIPHHAYRSKVAWFMVMVSQTAFKIMVLLKAQYRCWQLTQAAPDPAALRGRLVEGWAKMPC